MKQRPADQPIRLGAFRTRIVALVVLLPCLAFAKSDQLVVTVGGTSYAVSEVQAWLDEVPQAELPRASKGRATKIRQVLEEVFVPQALLTEYAEEVIGADDAFASTRDQALARTTERLLASTIEVGEDEIAGFYERYRDRYVRPEAIHIWRILVSEESKARQILAAVVDKRLGVYEWGNLARIHSVDEATKHRDGSLGFVRADGSTDVPQVRVNRAVYEAAQSVKDGQIVPNPVREGEAFALVWRRGTRPEQKLSLESQRRAITTVITRHKVQQARETLVAELRTRYLKDTSPDLLDAVVFPLPMDAQSHTAADETATQPGTPNPRKSDRGER